VSVWTQGRAAGWLAAWPEGRPPLAEWLAYVHEAGTEAELAAVRRSVVRGAPFGESAWVSATAKRLGLESTLRTPGRPRQRQPSPSP
jgi:putative transposase